MTCTRAVLRETFQLSAGTKRVRAALCAQQKSLEKVIVVLLPANPAQSHLQQQRNPPFHSPKPLTKTIILLVSASVVASVGCHRVAR